MAVVGRPNVGKSSLVNAIMDYKISIVSPKPQTTRDRIRCVYSSSEAQIIFMDTPGIHLPKHKLGERLVERASQSLEEADLILYVISADDRRIGVEDRRILGLLGEVSTPVLLVINKIDLVTRNRGHLLELMDMYRKVHDFAEILPVSVFQGFNVKELLDLILPYLPEGYPFYSEDVLTDKSERFLASEIIREKAIGLTDQEVPHSIAVEIDEFKTPDEYPERKDIYIRGTIYVERKGQKLIILGRKGEKLKQIGLIARKELERIFGYKVYLELWIKIRADWRNSESELKRLGYGKSD